MDVGNSTFVRNLGIFRGAQAYCRQGKIVRLAAPPRAVLNSLAQSIPKTPLALGLVNADFGLRRRHDRQTGDTA